MTYLDVVDTAVKVGLGALISGISAYWVGKSKTRDDLARERLARHQSLLEKSSEQIETFSNAAFRYYALLVGWLRLWDRNHGTEPGSDQELAKARTELFDAFNDLTSAESKLLLLGHRDAQKALRNFGEVARRIAGYSRHGDEPLTEAKMQEDRLQLLDKRQAVFDELSRIYRSET